MTADGERASHQPPGTHGAEGLDPPSGDAGRRPRDAAAPGTLPFGPYAGCSVADVAVIDPAYLLGLVREAVGPAELRAEAARALAERGHVALVERGGGIRLGRLGSVPPWAAAFLLGCVALAAAGIVSRTSAPVAGGTGAATPPPATSSAGAARPSPHAGPSAVSVDPGSPRQAAPSPLPAGTPRPCGARIDGAIPAEVAGDYVDTFQTVEFEVVRTKDTGRVTFLNSRDPYQGHFYVAIFPSDYGLYPQHPAIHFRGRCIVVQGTIELYRGAPQMVLRGPEDVRIVDPPPSGDVGAGAP